MALRPKKNTTAIGLIVLSTVGCLATQPATSQRLADLDARIAASDKRLVQVNAEVAASEVRAERAREYAEVQACLAENAELRAMAVRMQAECLEEVALFNACEAEQSKAQAGGTVLGCLIGIGVAAGTGGLGAPIAMGGCGAGYLAGGSSHSCSPVRCEVDQQKIERKVLSTRRLAEVPLCGGYLGLGVEDLIVRERIGVRVTAVGPGTTAASIGLAKGDIVVAIDSRKIRSPADIDKAMARVRTGATLRVNMVRGRHLFRFNDARVEHAAADGSRTAGPAFGAVLDRRPVTTRYSDGVKVLRVDGPAKLARLQRGDVIKGADGTLVRRRLELRQLLTGALPGQTVRFAIKRAGKHIDIDVELEARNGRRGI